MSQDVDANGIRVSTPAGSVEAQGRVVVILVVISLGFLAQGLMSRQDHQALVTLLERQIQQREDEIKEKRVANWLLSLPANERPRLPRPIELIDDNRGRVSPPP